MGDFFFILVLLILTKSHEEQQQKQEPQQQDPLSTITDEAPAPDDSASLLTSEAISRCGSDIDGNEKSDAVILPPHQEQPIIPLHQEQPPSLLHPQEHDGPLLRESFLHSDEV